MMRQRQNMAKGFTLLELVIVIIVISVLALFAMDRFWTLRAQAERAAVKTVTGNIRSALGLEVAKYALNNQLHRIPQLNGANPMPLLAQMPADYLGETTDEAQIQETGVWYFNPQSKILVYRVRFSEYFKSDLQAPHLRYQVKLIYTDKNKNGRFDLKTDSIDGLDLVNLDTYQWITP